MNEHDENHSLQGDVGRATVFTVGLAVILAVMLGVATTALAAVPRDPFKLGRLNTINAVSRLVGNINNAMLRIDNNSTGASATALDLQVEPGKPPMKVNSAKKVARLNADKLDGLSSGAFLRSNGKAADADKLDAKDSTAFLSSSTYTRTILIKGTVNNLSGGNIHCDSGDPALGGGFYAVDQGTTITANHGGTEGSSGTGVWSVSFISGATADTVGVTVLCADVAP